MCFSASASFTASVMLSFVATETYRKVHKPSQLAMASIPAFFAFQQFSEGVVWLTIGQAGHSAALRAVSSHIFLLMAQAVWPVLIPLSVMLLEKNKTRKKVLLALLAVGAAVAAYYSIRLALNGANPQVIGWHIVYQDTTPDLLGAAGVLFYLAATIAPLFISTVKRVHILGTIMSVSFVVSVLFYIRYLTSVWCFFAAVMSFVVYYIIRDAHTKYNFDLINGLSKILQEESK